MIFHRVDAYFPCQKGGPRKILRPKRGALKIFRANFFLHQALPYKCLWTVPYFMRKFLTITLSVLGLLIWLWCLSLFLMPNDSILNVSFLRNGQFLVQSVWGALFIISRSSAPLSCYKIASHRENQMIGLLKEVSAISLLYFARRTHFNVMWYTPIQKHRGQHIE